MPFSIYSGQQVFFPGHAAAQALHRAAEQHLRAGFSTGEYTDAAIINNILKRQFAFYLNALTQDIQPIASLEVLEFLLSQYDVSTHIARLYKNNQMPAGDRRQWAVDGPIQRRALKYMIERIVLISPAFLPSISDNLRDYHMERAFSAAQELVKLYNWSEQAYSINTGDLILVIRPPGTAAPLYLVDGHLDTAKAVERARLDTLYRNTVTHDFPAVVDLATQDKSLGPAFEAQFGVTYGQIIEIFEEILFGADELASFRRVPFIQEAGLIQLIVETTAVTAASAVKIVEGFSIWKEAMAHEQREIWDPKQEYRLHRRGFILLPGEPSRTLVFSRELAHEALHALAHKATFQQVPLEWQTGSINRSLKTLSNEAGKWFEKLVAEKLASLQFKGVGTQARSIGQGANRLRIPQDVGEIDYIGYSAAENLLLLVECKLTDEGAEPKFFRDTLSKFVSSSDSYATKFRKKIEWVSHHHAEVASALESTHIFDTLIAPTRLATAMLTYYPSFASDFIPDFPCVSVTELVRDYVREGRWPYEVGLF